MNPKSTEEPTYFYLKKFIGGGISGCIGKTIVAPIDRIKIIYMVLPKQVSPEKFTYWKGISEVRSIVRDTGARSLWRGNVVTCLRVFPSSALVAPAA